MRPRVSLRSDTAVTTCGKHVLTCQLPFTVVPISNGKDRIKPDLMKKMVTIPFPTRLVQLILVGREAVVGIQTFDCSFSSGS